jgi:hypothetical protein
MSSAFRVAKMCRSSSGLFPKVFGIMGINLLV